MLKIYNGATTKNFTPINRNCITIYTCGMTVYSFTHIGHLKSYMTSDIVCRYLRFLGYNIRQVMNVTDVGHHVKDADIGEDKLERKALKENSSPWEIARHYERVFFAAIAEMNISRPNIIARASEHINDMIDLIKKLEENNLTYMTNVGVIFDTSKFEDYTKFASLDLRNQKAGYRVQIDDERRAPWDFALWITNKPNHIMSWKSPWGKGYPGWHIECSAMSKKYLGEQIDIHTGGVDHIKIHHTNEIAQSEGASGKKFVNYWIHTDFLQVNKEKMSKSQGNLYTLENLKENGYSPLSLRYLFLKSDYKKPFDFTWESLYNSQNELVKLWKICATNNTIIYGQISDEYKSKFIEAMDDSFNTSKAITVLWEVINDKKISLKDKMATVYFFDQVLALDLENAEYNIQVLEDLQNIDYWKKQSAQLRLLERDEARKDKDYITADKIRKEIEADGFSIVDTLIGSYIQITNFGKLGDNMNITAYGEEE